MSNEPIVFTPEELEAGRLAIEDELISNRDSRIGILGRGNGLVVYEKDGSPSSIIRITTESAILIALEAVNELRKQKGT